MNWKHILHTVRKDLCAQRFHLILFACLLVLYVALVGLWGDHRPAGASFITVIAQLLPVVIMVYGLAVAVVLIHQDPVAGTSAFWLTRPVRGASLLVAKAIEVAAVLGLWFLADLLVLLASGAPDHTGYLSFSFATSLLPVVLFLLAIAALAPNISRFLLTIALLTVGAVVIAMVVNLVGGWFQDPGAAESLPRSPGQSLSANLVGAAIASLGAVVVLVWQFVTRRTGISIALTLIAGIGASLAMANWSHDFIPRPTNPDASSGRFAAARVEIDRSDLRSGTAYESTGDSEPVGYRTVSGLASVQGLPEGVFAWWSSARSRVITPDGREFIQLPERTYEYASSAGISSVLGGARVGGGDGGKWWRALVRTTQNEFEQFAGQPCTFESEIQLDLFNYELVGELPLEVGAGLKYDDLQIQITGVVPISDRQGPAAGYAPGTIREFEIHFSEKYPISRLKAVRHGRDSHNLYSDLIYILVNRERKEAMRSGGGGSSSFSGIRMMFRNNDRHLDFRPAYTGAADEKLPALDEAWLEGATLAVLKRHPLGSITRTATIDEIVFGK
ncbi:MAG: hypothetical protein ACR2RV_07720 [Verrucomicrobiales bacterium]